MQVQVSFEKGEALIEYDDQKVTIAKLREIINRTGFKAAGKITAGKSTAQHGKMIVDR